MNTEYYLSRFSGEMIDGKVDKMPKSNPRSDSLIVINKDGRSGGYLALSDIDPWKFVDSALSATSDNTVENSAITKALSEKIQYPKVDGVNGWCLFRDKNGIAWKEMVPGDFEQGDSAYDIWLRAPHQGTKIDFLNSLIGIAGERGAIGGKGATGAQGAKGETGAQGSKGATGAQGAKGATGATGDRGSQGASGRQGETGDTGAEGPKGPTGDSPKGNTGAEGPKGNTGAEGPKGSRGDQGPMGPQGAQGNPGAWGWESGYGGSSPSKGPDFLYEPIESAVMFQMLNDSGETEGVKITMSITGNTI
jgi:hypothetical protein